MEGLHVPPWDIAGSSFQEYPKALPYTPAQRATDAAKSEKALRREQEKLNSMINGVVRLSATSSTAAGEEVASAARRKTKKHEQKKGSQGERDKAYQFSQNIQVQASEQATPRDETLCPLDAQRKPKLGKRKAADLDAPLSGSAAQPVPVSDAGPHEVARKRNRARRPKAKGLGQEAGSSCPDVKQNAGSAQSDRPASKPALATHHGQAGAEQGITTQPKPHKNAPSSLAPESAPQSPTPELARKKRSRNKFKQDHTAGQPELHDSASNAPGSPTPDAVRVKRNQNKFKQADAAGQLHKGSAPEARVQQGLQNNAAATGKGAKQQGIPEPAPSALQHDNQSDRQAGNCREQMLGRATGRKSKADEHTRKPGKEAGEGQDGRAMSGSQVAGATSGKQGKDGLLSKMRAKLAGSQFRWLNEQLYTCPGSQAFELMQEQPQLFAQYHEGFKQQTAKWPLQPIQAAAAYLAKHSRKAVVADFGCGDAELARMAPQETVHSLDLVRSAPGVIACNMADTPLDTASVDVAVFCLALMGTDYPTFLQEAARVLKPHGIIWIAEVRSRFVPEDGAQEDYRPFLQAMAKLGFAKKLVDCSNSHFVTFELQRQKPSADGEELKWPHLRACAYKKR